MNNICENYRIRTKKRRKYAYCVFKQTEIPFICTKDCDSIKVKANKKNGSNWLKIANKSGKQKKLEDIRYSILQNDLNLCYFCQKEKATEFHELLKGRNRKKCMKWGLCVKVCRKCHRKTEDDSNFYKKYRIIAQKYWCNYYNKTNEEFIKEFGINYEI